MTPDSLPPDDDDALDRILRDVTGPGVVLDAELFDWWWKWNYDAVCLELKAHFYPDDPEFRCAARHSARMREVCERELFSGL